MLVIREGQMAIFERAAESRFEEKMMRHLGERFPEQAGNPSWRPIIRGGITKARGYGIHDERSIAQLVGLMVVLGQDFDAHDDYRWTRSVLGDVTVDSDARVEMVVEVLDGRATDAAETEAAS